jgi:hypothetical protein
MNEHTCPVCGYDQLEFPPRDYSICACCGTEFGYDDRALTHGELRARWMSKGCVWFDVDEPRPLGWSAYDQLLRARFITPFTALMANSKTDGDSVYRIRPSATAKPVNLAPVSRAGVAVFQADFQYQ